MRNLLTKDKVVRYTKSELKKMRSQTNWRQSDRLKDEDLDYKAAPEFDEKVWAKAKVIDPKKKAISIRVDSDVLDWYKHQEGRYQKLINQVLRQYMQTHQ